VGAILLVAVSWKWCLPRNIAAIICAVAVATGAAAGLSIDAAAVPPLATFTLTVVVQLVVYLAALAYRFYRDPERAAPSDPAAVVSPADGTVIYVRRIAPGSLLECDKRGSRLILDELTETHLAYRELWQIGISMVFTDVHVNRAPIAGRVLLSGHRPGQFLSLRRADAVNLNERQTLLLDNGRFQVAIVQIASRLVRRIQSYVQPGQHVDLAQRIGMIKFGSQVDLFLPLASVGPLCVEEGDIIKAGETIVCHEAGAPRAV
jgi:phosphatidylserine decarboxylase